MHLLTYRTESSDAVDPTELPIWLVDPKSQSAHEITSEEELGLHLKSYNAAEVVHVGWMFAWCFHLPTPLVNRILEMAGIWIGHHATTYEEVEGWAPMEREYFRLAIPHDMSHKMLDERGCRALTIECVSHDQGWAMDSPELNYSYFNCNSWVEFEVIGPLGEVIVPRLDVCRNFRACGAYRRHMLHLTDHAILNQLVPGCHISVYLRAQLPGWSNHAKYGRIMVQYGYGIKESVLHLYKRSLSCDLIP